MYQVFVCGALQNNTIILFCSITKKAIVIDPAQNSFSIIKKFVEEKNLHIEKILLTHSHWDHIIGVADVQNRWGVDVYVHPLDLDNLQQPGIDKLPFSMPVKKIKRGIKTFQDNEKICLGNITIEVLHTPGHSPGSVCFYINKENLLFSGDTLFQGSFGNVSFPLSNPKDMKKSLQKLSLLPKETLVIPGHGNSTSIGEEAWLNNLEGFF